MKTSRGGHTFGDLLTVEGPTASLPFAVRGSGPVTLQPKKKIGGDRMKRFLH